MPKEKKAPCIFSILESYYGNKLGLGWNANAYIRDKEVMLSLLAMKERSKESHIR
jgi:hypothetical protein